MQDAVAFFYYAPVSPAVQDMYTASETTRRWNDRPLGHCFLTLTLDNSVEIAA